MVFVTQTIWSPLPYAVFSDTLDAYIASLNPWMMSVPSLLLPWTKVASGQNPEPSQLIPETAWQTSMPIAAIAAKHRTRWTIFDILEYMKCSKDGRIFTAFSLRGFEILSIWNTNHTPHTHAWPDALCSLQKANLGLERWDQIRLQSRRHECAIIYSCLKIPDDNHLQSWIEACNSIGIFVNSTRGYKRL